jgi:hypothetical protein
MSLDRVTVAAPADQHVTVYVPAEEPGARFAPHCLVKCGSLLLLLDRAQLEEFVEVAIASLDEAEAVRARAQDPGSSSS